MLTYNSILIRGQKRGRNLYGGNYQWWGWICNFVRILCSVSYDEINFTNKKIEASKKNEWKRKFKFSKNAVVAEKFFKAKKSYLIWKNIAEDQINCFTFRRNDGSKDHHLFFQKCIARLWTDRVLLIASLSNDESNGRIISSRIRNCQNSLLGQNTASPFPLVRNYRLTTVVIMTTIILSNAME